MPTPTGKLKAGDLIRQKATGAIWRVTERLGNDELYAVRLVPHGGGAKLPLDSVSRGYMLMTETAYYLKHGWELLRR